MEKATYMEFVLKQIYKYEEGFPILVRELGCKLAVEFGLDEKKANAAAAVAVKRILDAGIVPELRCFSKGIYYLAKKTVFGETGINKEKLIAIKYLNDDNGYETGVTIMHKLGLTSLMPAERTFVSNYAQNRTKKDDTLGIIVRTPKTRVTKENRRYLQFLDLLNIYDDVPVDAEEPYAILGNFVRNNSLNYETLLTLANRHYNSETIIRLARVAGSQGGRA